MRKYILPIRQCFIKYCAVNYRLDGLKKLSPNVREMQDFITSHFEGLGLLDKTFSQRLGISIEVPKTNFDIDSFCKMILDSMQNSLIINNDNQIDSLELIKTTNDFFRITVFEKPVTRYNTNGMSFADVNIVSYGGLYRLNNAGKVYRRVKRVFITQTVLPQKVVIHYNGRSDLDNIIKTGLDFFPEDKSVTYVMAMRKSHNTGLSRIYYE